MSRFLNPIMIHLFDSFGVDRLVKYFSWFEFKFGVALWN